MIDTNKLYTRAQLCRELEIDYNVMTHAIATLRIPKPSLPLGSMPKYFTQMELMKVLAWADMRKKVAMKEKHII